MTGEQKIEYIAKQIAACKDGRQDTLNCPYCDEHNIKGNPLCCTKFATAVAAILVRQSDRERRENMERIMEKVEAN